MIIRLFRLYRRITSPVRLLRLIPALIKISAAHIRSFTCECGYIPANKRERNLKRHIPPPGSPPFFPLAQFQQKRFSVFQNRMHPSVPSFSKSQMQHSQRVPLEIKVSRIPRLIKKLQTGIGAYRPIGFLDLAAQLLFPSCQKDVESLGTGTANAICLGPIRASPRITANLGLGPSIQPL